MGRRARYLEDYQPTLASTLAACLMVDELPTISDLVGAADDEKKHVGRIIHLPTDNCQEAVRGCSMCSTFASKLGTSVHRCLAEDPGKPWGERCCFGSGSQLQLERYKKPDSVPPAVLNDVKQFNRVLKADVMCEGQRPQVPHLEPA